MRESQENMQPSLLATPLPWQGEQWQRMHALFEAGRMPHALLISGASGVGKGQFALALAQFLLCEQPRNGLACDQCRQCGFNRAATHPDLKRVTTEEKARQIKVEQVRDVVAFFSHTAQQGGYKIAIIQPADAMNSNAANALLKSLEEPAGKSLLILVTDMPGRLMATIRSRCQSLNMPLPERSQALAWLSSVTGSAEQAATLLEQTQGRPLAALALLDSDGLQRLQRLDTDFLALLDNKVGPLTLAEKWQDFELAEILIWLSQRLSVLIAGAVAGGEVIAPWRELIGRACPQSLYELLDRVNQLHRQLSQGANPNRQLALEDLLLASCDKFHNQNRG